MEHSTEKVLELLFATAAVAYPFIMRDTFDKSQIIREETVIFKHNTYVVQDKSNKGIVMYYPKNCNDLSRMCDINRDGTVETVCSDVYSTMPAMNIWFNSRPTAEQKELFREVTKNFYLKK